MKSNIVNIILGSALAVGLTLPVGIPISTDKDWGASCRSRLERAKAKLDHDVARHPPDSRQTDRDRDELENARPWCRDHHAGWDHDRFDIGICLRQ
jgi:hypothetical protein